MLNFNFVCALVVTSCPNEYAKAYAKVGMRLTDRHAQRVQALYILNNMQYWRTDEARMVRKALKEYAK